METLFENVKVFIQADGWMMMLMWLIGGILITLAIVKDMEPSLLLPIGFGAILMNLPNADLGIIELLYNSGIANTSCNSTYNIKCSININRWNHSIKTCS